MPEDASHLEEYWDWAHTVRDWPRGNALPIVQTVLDNISTSDRVLYIGVGDGRNFLTLLENGVNVVGSDLSRVSIDRLVAYDSSLQERLFYGDFADVFGDHTSFDAVIVSRVLIQPNLAGSVASLTTVCDLLGPSGQFFAEWTAVGTDPWPGWASAEIDIAGNLRLRYASERVHKIYLSFLGSVELVEGAGFEITHGPVSVDLPRSRYPGGIVRDWLIRARARTPIGP